MINKWRNERFPRKLSTPVAVRAIEVASPGNGPRVVLVSDILRRSPQNSLHYLSDNMGYCFNKSTHFNQYCIHY